MTKPNEPCRPIGAVPPLRWNVEKNEWRQIESPNTPPPRCSHQAAFFRDHLYVLGGEFATTEQFYHYKDFWRLNVKVNAVGLFSAETQIAELVAGVDLPPSHCSKSTSSSFVVYDGEGRRVDAALLAGARFCSINRTV